MQLNLIKRMVLQLPLNNTSQLLIVLVLSLCVYEDSLIVASVLCCDHLTLCTLLCVRVHIFRYALGSKRAT